MEYLSIFFKKINEILGYDPLFRYLTNTINSGDNEVKIVQKEVKVDIDKKWIEIIEEVLPYLDQLIRNPKEFIDYEEELVDISNAKKVGKENVKFLATHSDLVYDVLDDVVIPSKVLNELKEDTYEIYENRFLYTLLVKLKDFVESKYTKIKQALSKKAQSEFVMNSDYAYKDLQLVVNFNTIIDDKLNNDNKEDVSELRQIEHIYSIIIDYMASEFAVKMAKTKLIDEPILYTNILKTEVNYIYALKLWDFISEYDSDGFKIEYVESYTNLDDKAVTEFKNLLFFNKLFIQKYLLDNKTFDFESVMECNSKDLIFEEELNKDMICVVPLDIYMYKVNIELRKMEEKFELLSLEHKMKLSEGENYQSLSLMDAINITNKYNEIDKKYVYNVLELIDNLKPEEYERYSLNEVKDEYLKRVKSLLLASHKRIIEKILFSDVKKNY